MNGLLSLEGVTTGYGSVQVLHGVSLDVRRDSCVALLGANGAGKTTLLKAISGLLRIRSGSVEFDGVDITNIGPVRIVRNGLSHAAEGRRIFTRQTVRANLHLGLFARKAGPEYEAERTEYVLELFPALRPRLSEPAGHLSGGQQQMLAIAQALICDPKLLVLDEPSMGLAPNIVTSVFQTLAEIRRNGTTVLLVEQEATRALELSDYVYILKTGRVAVAAEPAQLSADDVRVAYLGA